MAAPRHGACGWRCSAVSAGTSQRSSGHSATGGASDHPSPSRA
ncbi:MAG: hypothetical protein VKO39_03260 [Cyanobacteriota bacterium]|nr:hypothetical protein [Cyanobacteriota bacterium]